MQCPKCSENGVRFGKTRDKRQRFRCRECRKTFSQPRPLGRCSTKADRAIMALRMLLEGTSIRATARLTGIDKDTVQRLMETAGRRCYQFLADRMQDLTPRELQVDEVWSFVGAKERTAYYGSMTEDVGDAYVFTAVDRFTKLLVCFHVGRRSQEDAQSFSEKLAGCIADGHRPHVATDGYTPYRVSIPYAFKHQIDHGMIVKSFGNPTTAERRRYSPPQIVSTRFYQNAGTSLDSQATTSHVERSNLTVRMQNRRFTRLTNAFSKKWENHELMFALFAAWYNFCRPHSTLKTTPAVAAGLAREPWTLERLLKEAAKAAAD